MSVADADGSSGRLAELRVSARGWPGIQLAVIGFIGFCGVMQDGRPDNPTWLHEDPRPHLDGRSVVVSLTDVVAVEPVDSC